MTKAELARNCIEKYIEIALRTNRQYSKRYLATVLYNENPDVFKDVEDARCIIRNQLNASGTHDRSKNKEDIARRFALIPDQIKELTDTTPFIVPTSVKKTLCISDIHSRFYDRKALEMAINYAVGQNCDSVIINGDYMDFYGHSKFDKNPAIQIIFEEQEWGVDILEMLQNVFGYVVLKSGNHCLRRQLHIERLAATMPELIGMSDYSDYLFFDGSHVQFVEDYRHILYGKLNIFHGHEYQGGGGIHVAYNRFNKALDNVLSGHSHKAQSVIRKDINGHIKGSWATGCLCDLNPRYAPKNDWTQGFAIIEKSSDGEFDVNNRVIHGNKSFPA